MTVKPKMYNDIVNYNNTDKWSFKGSYGDKKKVKLWIDIFGKNETTKDVLHSSVLFLEGELSQINWICYNDKMLKDINQVDKELRQLLIDAATETSKKYLK